MINATANMTIQSVKNVTMTQLVFSCNAGYNLIGPSNITCLESGRWSDTPPVCKKSNGKLRHLVAGIKESATSAQLNVFRAWFYQTDLLLVSLVMFS